MKRAGFWYFGIFLLLLACEKDVPRISPQGTKYWVHREHGAPLPSPGDYIFFHSEIRIKDSVINSSKLQGAIPRLQLQQEQNLRRRPSPIVDVLRYMSPGDSVSVEVPLGDRGQVPKGFEDAQAMFYEVVCLNILPDSVFREKTNPKFEQLRRQMRRWILKYNEGRLKEVQTTASGLKYLLVESGNGSAIEEAQNIRFHYYGALVSTELFDASFRADIPATVQLGEKTLLPGLKEGLSLLNQGAKALLILPPELAFGAEGKLPKIPAEAVLFYYVEIL